MASAELNIKGQKYLLRGDETDEHLAQVVAVVRKKLESVFKKEPGAPLTRAAMVAAFDLASELIKGKTKALRYRGELTSRIEGLLGQTEAALKTPH